MRKILLRNAVSASKNANCQTFTNDSTTIIPFFHTKKHNASLTETTPSENSSQAIPEFLCIQLINPTSEFLSNVLSYISSFVVAKLLNKLTCPSCKRCFLSQFTSTVPDHDCCAMNYCNVTSASAFTVFVNGGLTIPSWSAYLVVEYAEKVFKCNVCKDGNQISSEARLKQKLILDVCSHFIMDKKQDIFKDHELGLNESVFEDDHRFALKKLVADKYFTLRLFTYAKRYQETVITKGQPCDRHKLTKSILFKNQEIS